MSNMQITSRASKTGASAEETRDAATEPNSAANTESQQAEPASEPLELAAKPKKICAKKSGEIDVAAYERKAIELRDSAAKRIAEATRIEGIIKTEKLRRAEERIRQLEAEAQK